MMARKVGVWGVKKQRNEYGRQIRREYEAGRLPEVRRCEIREFVPVFDGVCRALTTILEDNLILEVYEDDMLCVEGQGRSVRRA